MQYELMELIEWPERAARPARMPQQPGTGGGAGTWFAAFTEVLLATARAYIQTTLASLIDLVRWPLYPAILFLTMLLTYRVSGRGTVDGYDVPGYLLIGTIGLVLWSSNLWSSGYAIEFERSQGTLTALFLTPASRAAVVLGYALGSAVIVVLPNVAIVALLAAVSGARLEVRDPLVAGLALVGLVVAAFCLGYALAGFFVLTRRANLLANGLQSPIYLLSGMLVPVALLPGPLRLLARAFPISAGMSALRAAALAGAGLSDVAGDLARLTGLSLLLLVLGTLLLKKVEHDAKSGATLDLE